MTDDVRGCDGSGLYDRPIRTLTAMALLTLPLLGIFGCSSIDTISEQPPPGPVREIAIGGFDSNDPDRQRVARHFRRALADCLSDSEEFEAVLMPPPPKLPRDAVLVVGRLVDVGDGSDVLRFIIGYGVGASSVRARIELRDAGGQVLAAFEDHARSVEGSASMSPWAGNAPDEVAEAMADGTAAAIVRWSKGEGLEPTLWDRLF